MSFAYYLTFSAPRLEGVEIHVQSHVVIAGSEFVFSYGGKNISCSVESLVTDLDSSCYHVLCALHNGSDLDHLCSAWESSLATAN